MRKLIMGLMILLAMSGFVFAGSLTDYEYNSGGDERSDSNVTVDADTLEGNSASYYAPMDYVKQRESQWKSDHSGIGTDYLTKFLTGMNDFFDVYDDFTQYLNENYVRRDVYETEVSELKDRLDRLEAKDLGLDKDEYQKYKALENREEGSTGTYGDYECGQDVCLKKVS